MTYIFSIVFKAKGKVVVAAQSGTKHYSEDQAKSYEVNRRLLASEIEVQKLRKELEEERANFLKMKKEEEKVSGLCFKVIIMVLSCHLPEQVKEESTGAGRGSKNGKQKTE